MELNLIYIEWSKDRKIDQTKIDEESINTPYIHSKYLKYLIDSRKDLKKLLLEQSKLKLQLLSYYKGHSNDPETLKKLNKMPCLLKILNNDIDKYIEADEQYCSLKEKIIEKEEIVSYLSEILKQLNDRQWQIRNYIEYQKILNGD